MQQSTTSTEPATAITGGDDATLEASRKKIRQGPFARRSIPMGGSSGAGVTLKTVEKTMSPKAALGVTKPASGDPWALAAAKIKTASNPEPEEDKRGGGRKSKRRKSKRIKSKRRKSTRRKSTRRKAKKRKSKRRKSRRRRR